MLSTNPSSKVRERILEVATELFYSKGIRNVGVDEIVARSGVAKMSLYKHFPSKDHLIIEFLHNWEKQWNNKIKAEIERRGRTPKEKLLAIFDVFEDWFKNSKFRGCAFFNAAIEIANPEHPAHQALLEHKQAVRMYIMELAKNAGIRNPEELSYYFMLLLEGATVMAIVEGNPSVINYARKIASTLLSVN